ncbi:MAG: hypothetical protein ACLGIR_01345 [Actinomycetes bacterium]
MRIRTAAVALLTLPLALSTVAANHVPEGCYVAVAGATEADDVIACQQQVWLHQSTTKVSNLASQGVQPDVSWNTTAPTASVSSGAGGGAAAAGASRTAEEREAAALVVEGKFTGVLDRMDVDLHLLTPLRTVYAPDDITIGITVNGVEIASPTTQRIVNVRPAPNASTGAAFQQDFVITGLAEALDVFGVENLPTTEHTIKVEFRPWFVNSGNWVYVFDTTEVPSNITFNAVTPDPAAAVLPVF